MLEDRDHSVRDLTARGFASGDDPRAYAALIEVGEHGSARARGDALMALCKVHEHKAAALIGAFLDVAASEERKDLLEALAECGGVEEIAVVEKWLRVGDTETRSAALRVLGKLGGEQQLSVLVRSLGEGGDLATAAAEALLETTPGRAALVDVARRDDGTVASESAFRGLVEVDGADVEALMRSALEHGSPARTGVAISYVTEMGLETALPQLIALAQSPRGKVDGLADAIALVGGESGARALVELSRSSGPLRQACFAALQKSPEGRGKVRELAIEALLDGTGKAEAVAAIANDPSQEATAALIGATQLPRLRDEAFDALASRGDLDSRRALEGAVQRGPSEVRVKAMEALVKRKDDATAQLLDRLVNDDDAEVRTAAVRHVMAEGGEASMSLLRRLSSDPKRVGDLAGAIEESKGGIPADTLVALTRKDDRVASSALTKLRVVDPDKALQVAKRCFTTGGTETKNAAFTVTTDSPLRARREVVESALRDRILADRAVSELASDGSLEALAMLRRTLEDGSLPIETRELAASALEDAGGRAAGDVKATVARVHALAASAKNGENGENGGQNTSGPANEDDHVDEP